MNKIEVLTNVCLVCINISGECINCISDIENALNENKIPMLFISAANIFTQGEKIYIAVYENDIFDLMKILGDCKNPACVKNYSINCSNSMIHWFGEKKNIVHLLKKAENDIKLLVLRSDEGICFCDNAYKRKVCALISSDNS